MIAFVLYFSAFSFIDKGEGINTSSNARRAVAAGPPNKLGAAGAVAAVPATNSASWSWSGPGSGSKSGSGSGCG